MGASWLQTYVELEPGVDLGQLNEKLKGLAFRKAGPACESIQIFLYPLNKMLLYGQFKDGVETGGGYIKTVSLFFLIGVLILFDCLYQFYESIDCTFPKTGVGSRSTENLRNQTKTPDPAISGRIGVDNIDSSFAVGRIDLVESSLV